jgi:hypothetical protein
LNYLYAILEAESRIAILSIGLDPGTGVLHVDLRARDSLALDVMEPVRPEVDRFVLELLRSHAFAVREFFETRQGICRVLPPLTHQLAEMTPRWTKAVAPVTEATVQAFLRPQSNSGARMAGVPTLLSEANRRAGHEAAKRKGPQAGATRGLGLARACQECGVVLHGPSRKYCDECFPDRRVEVVANFASAGPVALAKRRAEGTDPAHTAAARQKQGVRAAENVRANREWEESNDSIELDFEKDILPGLQSLPLSQITQGRGLSLRYCALIRRGLKVPHPRHWPRLSNLAERAHRTPSSVPSPR